MESKNIGKRLKTSKEIMDAQIENKRLRDFVEVLKKYKIKSAIEKKITEKDLEKAKVKSMDDLMKYKYGNGVGLLSKSNIDLGVKYKLLLKSGKVWKVDSKKVEEEHKKRQHPPRVIVCDC